MEIWKPVVGSDTHYVSNLGRLRGPRGLAKGYVKKYPGTQRPVAVIVSLTRTRTSLRLHRLVLEAFVGPAPEGMEGCHNDGDPTNNALSNLRWDTKEANRADMVKHGTRVNPPTHWGEKHHKVTLTDAQVAEIRRRGVPRGAFSKVGKEYGVSHQTIRRIMAGLTRVGP